MTRQIGANGHLKVDKVGAYCLAPTEPLLLWCLLQLFANPIYFSDILISKFVQLLTSSEIDGGAVGLRWFSIQRCSFSMILNGQRLIIGNSLQFLLYNGVVHPSLWKILLYFEENI